MCDMSKERYTKIILTVIIYIMCVCTRVIKKIYFSIRYQFVTIRYIHMHIYTYIFFITYFFFNTRYILIKNIFTICILGRSF